MKNYTVYHLHTDMSNAFTIMDSVTKYKSYIDTAKELNMNAIAFSEHGSVLSWISKKQYCEDEKKDENGNPTVKKLKYIHATEVYVTETIEEKVRDNFHAVLIAKNLDGVKELNKLSSKSFNRTDGHYYYSPRVTYDELKGTSDNIIITTSCLGGILNNGSDELQKDFISFLHNNKHRAFLEIQHHNVEDQILYNQKLYDLSLEYDIPLIAGTDTHALNESHMKGRKLLQKRKGIHFDNEDSWDLSFKTYDELVMAYKLQNSLSEEIYLEAIENTNLMSDMIEEFSLDRANKYPKMHDDSEKVLREKIAIGFENRGLNKKENKQEYLDRIEYELGTYKHNGAIDFILLEEDIKSAMKKEDIHAGYSRGSVSGSLIAYILGVTDVDSIKFKMNFERFMNPERVSLCDVDSDWSLKDRPRVKEYIYSIEGTYSSEIITFNTIALKGAIRDCGGGLDMDLSIIDEMSKNIETKEDFYREKYKELFEYVDMLQGTIVSIGVHPAASIVSPIPLDEELGVFTSTTCPYPISQVNMKEVDSLNFVKLDVLGLDNIGIINDTCKRANIERLVPDNMDFEDEKVWDNILKSPVNIFQFEGSFAWSYLCQLLSKYDEIKSKSKNVTKVSLMSLANGAIRPAGSSYRDEMGEGIVRDNGNIALNEMMSDTMGYLVYQEQIMQFLNKFCGYTMGEADVVRRAFAKKYGTEKYIPEIRKGFISTMIAEYDYSEERAEKDIDSFLQVIEDASRYLFSLNHSDPYTFTGFATAYLRTYHPLEFISTVLDYNQDDLEKTGKVVEYANKIANITIKSAKFRFSSGDYTYDRDNMIIYKGIASIKSLNANVGNSMYELKDNQYDSFLDLIPSLLDCGVKKNQMDVLIKLDFFSEFGKAKKLLKVFELYSNIYNAKVIKIGKYDAFTDNVISKYARNTGKQYRDFDAKSIVKELLESIPDENLPLSEIVEHQLQYLGYINYTNKALPTRYVMVMNLDMKYTPFADMYSLNNGNVIKCKISKRKFDKTIKNGTILYVKSMKSKFAYRKIGEDDKGKPLFEKDYEAEKQWWIEDYSIPSNLDKIIERLEDENAK